MKTKRDRRAAGIKAKLVLKGISCADLDRQHGFYEDQCSDALYEPNKAGEAAIAAALGIPASRLWPERYDPKTGERLSPQPESNYRPRSGRSPRPKRRAS